MFLPLATGKKEKGKGFPRIVDDVYTVSIPGECIDVAVTEEYIAVNPASESPWIDPLRKNAASMGLSLVEIDELHELSLAAAAEIGATPPRTETTDEPGEVVEWRAGTILDTIFKPVG